MIDYSYDRRVSSAQGSEDFIEMVKRHLSIEDRQIRFKNESNLGGTRYDTVYVNFYNLPKGSGSGGGGAEAENNRMLFSIEGFGQSDPHEAPPSGKVKIEMKVSALPREYRMRAKSGPPEAVARYLADFLNKVVKDVPPKLTHSGG